MKTSQLAKQAQVNIETIRYYERSGLIPKAPRRLSGYREFTERDAKRIKFIKRAQELGFTLKEIKELLSLQAQPEADRAEVKQATERKITDIAARIRDLERMKETLIEIAQTCEGPGPTHDCPILQAFEQPLDPAGHYNPKEAKL